MGIIRKKKKQQNIHGYSVEITLGTKDIASEKYSNSFSFREKNRNKKSIERKMW